MLMKAGGRIMSAAEYRRVSGSTVRRFMSMEIGLTQWSMNPDCSPVSVRSV